MDAARGKSITVDEATGQSDAIEPYRCLEPENSSFLTLHIYCGTSDVLLSAKMISKALHGKNTEEHYVRWLMVRPDICCQPSTSFLSPIAELHFLE
jgi:hypothetical protein